MRYFYNNGVTETEISADEYNAMLVDDAKSAGQSARDAKRVAIENKADAKKSGKNVWTLPSGEQLIIKESKSSSKLKFFLNSSEISLDEYKAYLTDDAAAYEMGKKAVVKVFNENTADAKLNGQNEWTLMSGDKLIIKSADLTESLDWRDIDWPIV